MSWEIHRLGLREAQNAQLQNFCLHSCLTDGQRTSDSGSRLPLSIHHHILSFSPRLMASGTVLPARGTVLPACHVQAQPTNVPNFPGQSHRPLPLRGLLPKKPRDMPQDSCKDSCHAKISCRTLP
jgi:hypothetical protein